MNQRLLHLFILLCMCVTLFGTSSVFAQEPPPPATTPAPPPPHVPSTWDPESGPRHGIADLGPGADLSSQALTLGQPGLSFRYLRGYGQTGVAYADDTNHLNYPWGIGADGSGNIWIGELRGNRALKYDNTGAFVQQIGIAGQGSLPSTYLWEVADVAVDGSGNVWVVDSSTGHVAEFNSAGVFQKELGVPWVHGSDNGHFASPVSIAFDASGNIYVSDGAPWLSTTISGASPAPGNQRIQVFQPNGTYITTIGVTGVVGSDNAHFNGPRHITIDKPNKLLLVADTGNNRVQIFNITNPSAPAYAGTLAPTGTNQFDNPSGVAIDASYIYVADTGNALIKVFNRSTQAFVAKVGDGPTGAYQFDTPYDVAVDGSDVYVADFGNIRVQKFTFAAPTFSSPSTYGSKGVPYLTDGTTYNRPAGVALAGDGSVFITEDDGERLIKVNPGGSPVWSIGTPGLREDWADSSGSLSGPADVAVDASGTVYVADRNHNRVQVFAGDGSYQATIDVLKCPGGVTVAPNGSLFVANTCDHTVKIYNASLALVGTLGVSGAAGSDNSHFSSPEDVAVDSSGNIYVSDQNNHRIQVFSPGLTYIRTIGANGSCGADFGRLCLPDGLAVDGSNRLYVSDTGNNRVQVFDSGGAYLTTIGGLWGPATGQLRSPAGVAVDAAGNVYVADKHNHRIQKFARAVPSWTQLNINGFGDRSNGQLSALAGFNNQVFAGTTNSNAVQLWRSSDGFTWSSVMTNGFGNSKIVGFDDLAVFGGKLYAGLWGCATSACSSSIGGQIYRSADGLTWSPIVTNGFNGDLSNGEVYRFAAFNNVLYAATWSWNSSHGGEIWSSPSGDAGTWSRAIFGGFGDVHNWATASFGVYNGFLYAGTYNSSTGAQLWRCSTCSGSGTNWTLVNTSGFGDAGNIEVSSMAADSTYLYASTMHGSGGGAQVWRCHLCDGTDWFKIADSGFSNSATRGEGGLTFYNGQLNFVVDNASTGAEVWRCTLCDGTDWVQVGFAGFGDSNNNVHADKIEAFFGRLYIGTVNYANGGELWTPPALPYPVVNSITRADASPTNAPSVSFVVKFSEAVIGVSADDFVLTTSSGLTGAALTGLSGSADTYTVTVSTGSGTGTLRLDLHDNNSILDELTGAKHLGGGSGHGSFSTGEAYTKAILTGTSPVAAQDGWVLESGETTNVGGTMKAAGGTLIVGDSPADQQYRSILSFNSNLPPGAVISQVTLMIRKAGQKGVNPFLKLGNLTVDVRKGWFGKKPNLQLGDFKAPGTLTAAFVVKLDPASGWYVGSLGASADTLINKNGTTQMRLRFTKDDNNDNRANYMTFYSGNATLTNLRPLLYIQYYLP